PATRRSGGMHYTSIENIHKVIDPLFLDSLKAEFNTIKAEPAAKKRERLLADFQDKLAGLTFLDPACGSGNFLTETYLSLRRLENEVIKARTQGQSFLGFEETNPVKVSIRQFRGIEVNDFAVTVATTALWISEAQTLAETEAIVRRDIDFLPLKSHAGIAEGNALALEWPAADYIIGNPPFIGRRYRTPAQIAEVARFFKFKDVDYVACWFKKAAQHIQGTHTRCAFVATNSITQGEQVSAIWSGLVKDYGVQIDFAHRTFRWDSEASQKAHVHCVIIGFSSSAVSSASGTQGVGSAGGLARTNAAPAQCARTNADAAQCARIGEVTLSDSAGEAARAPSTQRTGRGRDSGWDAVWHSRGYLPHCEWQQLQSVTFRLYDSVPSDTIAQWKASLQHTSEDKEEASMNSKLRKLIVQYEDAGMGQCFLRDAAVADMVQQAILRRDGTLYRLIRWCIMPNHVHMLIEPLAGVSLSDIMRSLRSYTAHEANRILNRRGKFWMNEYFDRFIRNAAHFANVVDYIDHNPVRAGLCHSPERWPWSSAGSSHRLSAVSSAVLSASEAQGVGSAGGLARTNADAAQCARTDTMPNFNEEKVTSSASAGEAARAPSTQRTGRGRSSGRIFLPDGTTVQAAHINAYLMDAPDVFIANRTKPLCDVPTMRNGNVPLDGDALKVEDADLRDFAECPHLLRRLIGGKELLNGHPRHVLWLVGVSPAEIRRYPKVYRRVEQCRANRLAMKDNATRRLAATPATFRDTLLPARYIALPLVSSERREYVPMAWFDSGTVPTNQVQIIPSATLSHFSVLTSSVHMAWMRAVCGRLKSDYRYSASVVYNNFPWPDGMASASEAQQAGSAGGLARIGEDTAALERCAQNILDARALYPDSSLADLYDPLTMPAELRKAHRDNDKAVLRLYGLPDEASEEEIVAHLFRRYAELTAESPEA
ncbi:MAG: transposase, partial [Bacteroidaceae bacterium]|nr:transposase [Bacteroidaceae bacterium]